MTGALFRLVTLLIAMLILIVLPSQAQIASVTDTSCTVIAIACTGVTMHGCNFTRFTVPATGDYILAAKMSVCDGTTVCAECESEAYLYVEDPPSLVDCVHTGPCCGAQQIHYTLSIDRTYLLYCCKVACVIHQADCDDCDAPCVAWATVQ